MTESKVSIEFSSAAEVKGIMEKMNEQLTDIQPVAGVGVLASFASAVATLAKEVEQLKSTVEKMEKKLDSIRIAE
jgi:prefoldin subunit 5